MVSDAGMPGISDPACRAVRAAIHAGYIIEVIPGPSSVVTALAGSGLPVARFCFEGFLPRKTGARQKKLEEISEYTGTIIFFVGPHHLLKYIGEMIGVFGDRPACVARELTKIHEEYVRGKLSEIHARYQDRKVKGEITLCIAGAGVESNYFD
ncbi:MAG: rRNA small subunit methyltransferase 1 [FCB group bacterium]|nr:rRNA small subunit methyltransferase 1 [FCB group bacterium]